MADAGFAALLLPLRQVQQCLDVSAGILHVLSENSLFEEAQRQLDTLPTAANFNPLQSRQQLATDIPPAITAVPEAIYRKFAEALQAPARQPGPLSRETDRAAALAQGGDADTKRLHAQALDAGTRARQATPGNDGKSPSNNASKEWHRADGTAVTAGNSIAGRPGASSGIASGAMTGSTGALPLRKGLPSFAATEVANTLPAFMENLAGLLASLSTAQVPAPPETQANAVPSAASGRAFPDMFAPRPPAAMATGATTMLPDHFAQLVQYTWDGFYPTPSAVQRDDNNKGAANPQRAAVTDTITPVTTGKSSPAGGRSASMLTPRTPAAAPGQNSASRSTPVDERGDSRAAQITATANTQPGNDVMNDEALAERLNRALIEQAWRGGADLS